MGNCDSKGKEVFERSKKIEKKIKDDQAAFENEIKLLLLGSGDSGKSTFARQMKIVHLNGFSLKEKKEFVAPIYNNIIQNMKSLVLASKRLEISLSPQNEEKIEYFEKISPYDSTLNPEIAKNITSLWEDQGIQSTFQRSSEFQLNDNCSYFFSRLDEISQVDYVPSVQDILNVRIKTTGITETQFSTKDLSFILIDVGGQRNERKKWIHCFEGVTALIFCVSASEYDQTLFEDENQNRMHESISLFAEICECQWFQATSIILFFNKMDLFEQKIKKVDLKVCFNDYEGGKDEKKAIDFIKEKFLSLNKNKDRQIYPHETCATNTDNIRKVFEGVKETLLKTVL